MSVRCESIDINLNKREILKNISIEVNEKEILSSLVLMEQEINTIEISCWRYKSN